MDWLPAAIDPVPEPWPAQGLVLRTPNLELRPDDDASVRELVALAHRGIHPAEEMPFLQPWTEADPRYLGRGMLQYFWSQRAAVSPEQWALHFVVRVGGRVAGIQSLTATRFPVLREVDTGSYLGREFQGHGHGIEMRVAVLALAFDHLGATSARSGYVEGNAASGAVSARLGYRPDGTRLIAPRGARAVERRVVLVPGDFRRPDWTLEVEGLTDDLAGLLGAAASSGGSPPDGSPAGGPAPGGSSGGAPEGQVAPARPRA